jgi:hypothetical protein
MRPQDDSASDNNRLQIGAAFEAIGLMAQGDYLRLDRLSKEVVSGDGNISDSDLDWTLKLLATSTEPVARSKVMVMLSVLGHRTPLPITQQERIVSAVAPFLKSEHKLDQLSAARAMSTIGPLITRGLHTPSDN